MSDNKKLKKAIRARQERTGERYTTARMHVVASNGGGEGHSAGAEVETDSLIEQIQGVLAAHPDLTCFGFRTVGGRGVGGVSQAENTEEFERERQRLLDDDAVRQIEACSAYLALVRKTRTARPSEGRVSHSSNGLKHAVEAWMRSQGTEAYIGNGAFIVAAIIAGFRVHRPDPASPNCLVGVDSDDVRAIGEGKDPREWRRTSRFVKWLFRQAGRGDRVGDLAEDCKRDFAFPRQGNPIAIRDYLSRHGDHVRRALEEARREYLQNRGA